MGAPAAGKVLLKGAYKVIGKVAASVANSAELLVCKAPSRLLEKFATDRLADNLGQAVGDKYCPAAGALRNLALAFVEFEVHAAAERERRLCKHGALECKWEDNPRC